MAGRENQPLYDLLHSFPNAAHTSDPHKVVNHQDHLGLMFLHHHHQDHSGLSLNNPMLLRSSYTPSTAIPSRPVCTSVTSHYPNHRLGDETSGSFLSYKYHSVIRDEKFMKHTSYLIFLPERLFLTLPIIYKLGI